MTDGNDICRKGLSVASNIPHVLFTIFLMLWLDGAINWDFFVVFIPMWFEMAVLLFSLIVAIRSWLLMPPDQRSSAVDLVGMFVVAVPLLVFAILLVTKLQLPQEAFGFTLVGVPLYVMGVLALLLAVAGRTQLLVNIAVVSLPLCVLVLLVGLRLDRVITCSWYAVLIPAWILFGLFLLLACCAGCLSLLSLPVREKLPIYARATGLQVAVAVLAVSALVVFAALLAARMDGAPFMWARVFIPLFVFQALVALETLIAPRSPVPSSASRYSVIQ